MAKKLISFPDGKIGEFLNNYISNKADRAAVTQSRVVVDALLLYIINDSMADNRDRIAASSIWNERNRSAHYTLSNFNPTEEK